MTTQQPVQIILIQPDKTITEMTLDGGLKQMQALVGGWIEPIGLKDGSTMWVNEEFSYKFTASDVNWVASDVASLGGCPQFLMRPILGPAFLSGPNDGAGYNTDVTPAARRWVQRVHREAGGTWEKASA